MRPIMDLFEQATRRPGAKVSRRLWEQASIDLEGAKKRASETATVLESDSDSESELNADPCRQEESRGARGLSGAEWSGVEE